MFNQNKIHLCKNIYINIFYFIKALFHKKKKVKDLKCYILNKYFKRNQRVIGLAV